MDSQKELYKMRQIKKTIDLLLIFTQGSFMVFEGEEEGNII
ncbi:MAG: hypothetical protein ACFFB0_16865 [Promethearchaeota archaeon]